MKELSDIEGWKNEEKKYHNLFPAKGTKAPDPPSFSI